jgi:toxin ParE1/3/4
VKPVKVQSQALRELRKARSYLDRQASGLGDELLVEVLESLSKIERDNLIGVRYEETRFRFYRLKRFSYVIYYECMPDRVRVVAIAHSRWRPGYWMSRKPE